MYQHELCSEFPPKMAKKIDKLACPWPGIPISSNSIVTKKRLFYKNLQKILCFTRDIILYFKIECTTWNSNSKMKLLDQNIQMCSPVFNYAHTKTMKIWFAANSRKKELNYHSQKQNGEHWARSEVDNRLDYYQRANISSALSKIVSYLWYCKHKI